MFWVWIIIAFFIGLFFGLFSIGLVYPGAKMAAFDSGVLHGRVGLLRKILQERFYVGRGGKTRMDAWIKKEEKRLLEDIKNLEG